MGLWEDGVPQFESPQIIPDATAGSWFLFVSLKFKNNKKNGYRRLDLGKEKKRQIELDRVKDEN